MATTINIDAGQRLQILATPRDQNGDAIPMDETWDIDSRMIRDGVPGNKLDLAPTIDTGKLRIDYDTVDLAAGRYLMDIRLTNPDGVDQFSRKITVNVGDTITPPSAR
jgi:hypothetical protein